MMVMQVNSSIAVSYFKSRVVEHLVCKGKANSNECIKHSYTENSRMDRNQKMAQLFCGKRKPS